MDNEPMPTSSNGLLTSPTEMLKLKPKKSILKCKQPSLEDLHREGRRDSHDGNQKAHFDELNILATHHPTDKDYGHMKIDEPKTPYYAEAMSEGEEDSNALANTNATEHRPRRVSLIGAAFDPEELQKSLEARAYSKPKLFTYEPGSGPESEEEDTGLSEEEKKHCDEFKKKRKAHYNEGAMLKQAKAMVDEELKNLDDE